MDALAGWKLWVEVEAEDCIGADRLEEDWADALSVAPKASRETATNRRIKETSLKLVAQIQHAEILHGIYGKYKKYLREMHREDSGAGMAAMESKSAGVRAIRRGTGPPAGEFMENSHKSGTLNGRKQGTGGERGDRFSGQQIGCKRSLAEG